VTAHTKCTVERLDFGEGSWNGIQSVVIKYLGIVRDCTRTDQFRNRDIRNELNIFPICGRITEYRDK
jgi:hypothetical protein